MVRGIQQATKWLCLIATLAITTVATAQFAEAGGCGCAACAPAYREVERKVYRTVMVPEKRTIQTTEYRPEIKERTITVYRRIPETTQVKETVIITVPVQKTRTIHCNVTRQVWEEVDRDYTVLVPHTVTKTGVRTVCRPVQIQTTRKVCRDEGHFEDVKYTIPCRRCHHRHGCRSCGGCGVVHVTRRVWRPNYVTVEVPVTICKNTYEQVKFEYDVTVCRPVVRTHKVRVCRYVTEKQERQVTYTDYEKREVEQTRTVTTCKVVAEERKQRCTVMVPYQVEKEVTVMVCRTVAETIICRVPVCGGR
jgi:hypothetical protein